MENIVWKYEIFANLVIRMPKNAQILSMQLQKGVPCIWALVNPKNELEERYFEVWGTGNEMSENDRVFIGTFQAVNEELVFHVFERFNVK